MSDFLDLNPPRRDDPEAAERGFAIMGDHAARGSSATTIAAAISEDELNACPYAVRKALYDYAERQFAFQAAVLRWYRVNERRSG